MVKPKTTIKRDTSADDKTKQQSKPPADQLVLYNKKKAEASSNSLVAAIEANKT